MTHDPSEHVLVRAYKDLLCPGSPMFTYDEGIGTVIDVYGQPGGPLPYNSVSVGFRGPGDLGCYSDPVVRYEDVFLRAEEPTGTWHLALWLLNQPEHQDYFDNALFYQAAQAAMKRSASIEQVRLLQYLAEYVGESNSGPVAGSIVDYYVPSADGKHVVRCWWVGVPFDLTNGRRGHKEYAWEDVPLVMHRSLYACHRPD